MVMPPLVNVARSRKFVNKADILLFPGNIYGVTQGTATTVKSINLTSDTLATSPSSLSLNRSMGSSVANDTLVIVSGGQNALSYQIEMFAFAGGGTKGANPAASNWRRRRVASAGNLSVAFIFGGDGSLAGTTTPSPDLDVVEQWTFASLGTRGVDPIPLSSVRAGLSAASNSQKAFVFGGGGSHTSVSIVEEYIFATPGTKGTPPPVLTPTRTGHASPSNNTTKAFVVGGTTSGHTHASTNETYLFTTPGTKGAAPASGTDRRLVAAAGTPDVAVFVGGGGTVLNGSRNYEKVSFASTATIYTSPTFLPAAENNGSAAAAK
jgi:hypothetical protein